MPRCRFHRKQTHLKSEEPTDVDELYATLQVSPQANASEIRRAYRRLALATHPDKPAGDEQRFLDISHAYAILADPQQREEYDREQQQRRQQRVASAPRRPPCVRVKLRPGREVVGEVVKDLEHAIEAITETLSQLWETLYHHQIPSVRDGGTPSESKATTGNVDASTIKMTDRLQPKPMAKSTGTSFL